MTPAPSFSSGVVSISGELIIDDGSVSGQLSGSIQVFTCAPLQQGSDCSILVYDIGLLAAGAGVKVYDDIVQNSPGNFYTEANNSITEITLASNFTISPVPVPAAAWLFGSAMIGLVGIKRKK